MAGTAFGRGTGPPPSTFAISSSATSHLTPATRNSSQRRLSAQRPFGRNCSRISRKRERRACSPSMRRHPSTLLAHKAGYIDRDNEVIVGLQTDQPFKRAIFPYGGLRMVEAGLKAAGFEPDPGVHEAFTKYRRSHNDGVFDAYTPEIMNCRTVRNHHRPSRRLRPRPHHRRLSARGALRDRPPARGQARTNGHRSTTCGRPTRSFDPARNWLSRCARSRTWPRWRNCTAATYRSPPRMRSEAFQWTYFAYLGAIKEANGAAMSIGRISSFLDIYIERDLKKGVLDEARRAGALGSTGAEAPDRPLPAHA